MKVLYIAHTSNAGGSTAALINILKGMRTKDIEVAVICPTPGPLVESIKELEIKTFVPNSRYVGYYVYPVTKSPLKWLKEMGSVIYRTIIGERYIASVIDEFKPDIVHSNSTACVAGFHVCMRKKIPHVWHVREFINRDFGWTPIPTFFSPKKRLHKKGNYNIAITKSVFDYFELRKQDTQIYDGVIDVNTSFEGQTEFQHPYFLFVGALTAGKGIDVAVTQFIEFHKSNNSHHLVIIGPTKDKVLLDQLHKQVAKANVEEFVHWLGLRDDVYSWMSEATALLVPSINEGFGFITAEGMYCGTPVIGRNTSGTKEQFDKGLLESGSEIGLRFMDDEDLPKLMQLVIDEDTKDMKEKAYSVVTQNYTIQANAERIYAFYDNVIKAQESNNRANMN